MAQRKRANILFGLLLISATVIVGYFFFVSTKTKTPDHGQVDISPPPNSPSILSVISPTQPEIPLAQTEESTLTETEKEENSAKPPGTIMGKANHPWLRRVCAVVYIEKIPGKTFTPPAEPIYIDQKNYQFMPHLVPVLVGSTVAFGNSDPEGHNVHSPPESDFVFNLGTFTNGVVKKVKCPSPGLVPLLCHLHPEMLGYILVVETPYFTTTEKDGAYRLENIPSGQYSLTLWHEKLKTKTVPVTVLSQREVIVNWDNLAPHQQNFPRWKNE